MNSATVHADSSFIVHRSSFGDSYSQLILDQLERANLFLVPLDDARQWYRYHHLFAEVLHARLRGGATASEVATLHQRASLWYEQEGLLIEAIQHALTAQHWERAAGMIEQIGMAVMLPGQVHTLLGWLAMFPDPLLRARPALAIVHGAAFMFANQIAAATARLDDAERSVQADTEPAQARDLLGQIAAVRGNLARLIGDLARCVALSQQALELLPETSFMQVLVRLNAAYVYLVRGDVTPATERMVTEVLTPVRATGNLATILRSLMLLARMHVHQGRLRQAAATYAMAAQVAPGPEGSPALINSAAYSFGMGDLLREWNDLDSAERYLRQGMALVPDTLTVGADVVTLGYLALAQLLQARGATSVAHAVLDAFAALARERGFAAHLVVRAGAVQAWLWLAQDDLPSALDWAEASGLSAGDEPDSSHDARLFAYEGAYLTLVRVAIAQRRANPSAQHLMAALDVLARLLHAAEAGARMHSVIEILSLRLIARGLSNQAIADTLIIAASTVKKHINNIYGKLDVQSRTQALVRAHDLNLL